MIPILLAIAAAALYFLPLIVPKPPPPDDIALPPVPGAPTPSPAGPDFVSAVRAVDIAVAYLVETEQYGAVQQQAARVMRAAVVEGATPPVPPGLMAVEEAEA